MEHAPDCCCEKTTMSKYSTSPINDEEFITRFVFSPLHVRKTGEIKPNIYDHIIDKGCSIQREDLASHQEIVSFISAFLEKINKKKTKEKDKIKWHSVLSAKC